MEFKSKFPEIYLRQILIYWEVLKGNYKDVKKGGEERKRDK
jgi:hypothetical protein